MKSMKEKTMFGIALCLMMLFPSFAQAAVISEDRYHFGDYESYPNIADYGEWWYFNLVQPNVQMVVQYSLWDPANLTDSHYGLMYVSVFYNQSEISIYFPIPWEYIITSETSADLVMGPNTITTNGEIYWLQGYVMDMMGNSIAWNLQYLPCSVPVYGYRQLEVYPNEEMNWYAQTPSATVYGAIILNGVPIPINANGYHDHNWGVYKLYHGLWNWFQTCDAEYSIVGYDFYTLDEGQITVQTKGKTITFNENQYMLINYDWTLNPEAMTIYPQKTLILAYNGKYFLALNITVQQTGLIGRAYPEGIVWIVFESVVSFKGILLGRGLCERINSVGFREYTTTITMPMM